MARENDWGYTRIMGELKKLGITPLVWSRVPVAAEVLGMSF
jgi:hypothetical protein